MLVPEEEVTGPAGVNEDDHAEFLRFLVDRHDRGVVEGHVEAGGGRDLHAHQSHVDDLLHLAKRAEAPEQVDAAQADVPVGVLLHRRGHEGGWHLRVQVGNLAGVADRHVDARLVHALDHLLGAHSLQEPRLGT